MSKKIIALILGTMMTVSLVGCSNRESKEDNTKTFAIENDEKYSNLDGEWSKDITLKIFDLLIRINYIIKTPILKQISYFYTIF